MDDALSIFLVIAIWAAALLLLGAGVEFVLDKITAARRSRRS